MQYTQSTSRIIGHHFEIYPHIILHTLCYFNTSPDGLVVRHVALGIAHHCVESLSIDWDMVRVHLEHLLSALATGILQVQFDIGKCLVDLGIDFLTQHSGLWIPHSGLWIPAACERVSHQYSQWSGDGDMGLP